MLPRVQDPTPETIGLGTIVGIATAGGVIMLALAIALRRPDEQRTTWSQLGAAGGFALGLILYLMALAAQLLCRQ